MVLALAGQLFPKISLLSSFTKKERARKRRGQRVWCKSGMKLVLLRQFMLCGLRSVFRVWSRLGMFFPCFEKVQLWSTLWKRRSVWILSGAVPQFVLALDLKAQRSCESCFRQRLQQVVDTSGLPSFEFCFIYTLVQLFLWRLIYWPLCGFSWNRFSREHSVLEMASSGYCIPIYDLFGEPDGHL